MVQVFGNSPDETAYCRLTLNRESTSEALLAIQPTLMAYSLEQTVSPVLLDVSSIQPNTILVLDSYFYVVVFHGSTIAQWRKQRYQDQAEYANFKVLLQVSESLPKTLYRQQSLESWDHQPVASGYILRIGGSHELLFPNCNWPYQRF